MRVTNTMLTNAALNDLGRLREQYAKAQALVNGRALERPSEDPQKVVEAMDITEMKMRLERAQRSGDEAVEWLRAGETSLSSMIELTQSARETIVAAGSPANLDEGAREQLANNLLSLRDAILREMNSKHRDQYLFAGFRTDVKPFDLTLGDPGGGVTYTADSDGEITRDIAPGLSVPINMPGRRLLENGDVISILQQTADDLRAGLNDAVIDTRLVELNTAMNHLIDLRSELGVRQATVEQYSKFAVDNIFYLEDRLAKLSGGDMERAVLKMAETQNAYQAALASFSKTMPMSLLDYLLR